MNLFCYFMKCVTCSEVNEGIQRFWRNSDAHGLPNAVDATDVTWGHLTSQLSQVPGDLLSCERVGE